MHVVRVEETRSAYRILLRKSLERASTWRLEEKINVAGGGDGWK
jgi:hypothetical protein